MRDHLCLPRKYGLGPNGQKCPVLPYYHRRPGLSPIVRHAFAFIVSLVRDTAGQPSFPGQRRDRVAHRLKKHPESAGDRQEPETGNLKNPSLTTRADWWYRAAKQLSGSLFAIVIHTQGPG